MCGLTKSCWINQGALLPLPVHIIKYLWCLCQGPILCALKQPLLFLHPHTETPWHYWPLVWRVISRFISLLSNSKWACIKKGNTCVSSFSLYYQINNFNSVPINSTITFSMAIVYKAFQLFGNRIVFYLSSVISERSWKNVWSQTFWEEATFDINMRRQ